MTKMCRCITTLCLQSSHGLGKLFDQWGRVCAEPCPRGTARHRVGKGG